MADTLAEALAELQANLPRIGKNADAQYGKYADLADVTKALLPRMAELGLIFTAAPTLTEINGEIKFVLDYELRHTSDHVDSVKGQYPLGTGTPQQLGSAITYARRYCLCAVTGVAPDEDDDDAAQAELAALQRRPPEVDRHGAATFAEQERMMHGPVPGVQRSNGTPADDPFYDPPTPSDEDKKLAGLRAMFAMFRELGITGKDEMLAVISGDLGRPVESRKDLSLAEITTVNIMLRRRVEGTNHESA